MAASFSNLMSFCQRSGIETVPDISTKDFAKSMGTAVLHAILNKSITPGEYKALFGSCKDLPDEILDLQTERKKVSHFARKKAIVDSVSSEELKTFTEEVHKQLNNFERVSTFLKKAESENPDAICGCSSVSCTETHAD